MHEKRSTCVNRKKDKSKEEIIVDSIICLSWVDLKCQIKEKEKSFHIVTEWVDVSVV